MFLKKFGIFYCGIILALLAASLNIAPAHAVSYTVTNTNDSGAGSLRDAIANAASGDIINFDPSLSGQNISLASTLNFSRNVTIDGSSLSSPITISGNNAVRVFYISPSATVTLNNLRIQNGVANTVISSTWHLSGGGIYNDGTLTVNNSTVSNNNASQWGGGNL